MTIAQRYREWPQFPPAELQKRMVRSAKGSGIISSALLLPLFPQVPSTSVLGSPHPDSCIAPALSPQNRPVWAIVLGPARTKCLWCWIDRQGGWFQSGIKPASIKKPRRRRTGPCAPGLMCNYVFLAWDGSPTPRPPLALSEQEEEAPVPRGRDTPGLS
jgi:hypothetical protein